MYEIKKELTTTEREKLNKYSDTLAKLLFHRGILDNKTADEFINVDYEKGINDPFLLKDIDKATDRILGAIKNKETICVYSDYDADGIPGAVVLSDFFRKIGYENFFSYIPHRNLEGFGLNLGAIEKISEKGAKLIITIDCGITDIKPIDLAVEKGIDVIVTDHHDPNGHEPNTVATINQKQPGCEYPDKNLCGAGVIFKVVQALIKKGNEQKMFEVAEGWEKWLLDMVGIATLSDMVPLVGENRVFAKYGLTVMQKSKRKGFLKLLKKAWLKPRDIAEDDVGFTISPRINAASRMDAPEMAYKMLFTDDDVEADQTVTYLDKINNERKGKVSAMVKDIKKFLDKDSKTGERKIIVHGNPNWQPSLLGLAASSIVDTYKRPVFLWGRGEGKTLKGSCRSDGSCNLVEIMNEIKPGVIFDFGGHEMAGGFEITDEGVFEIDAEMEKAFEKAKTKNIDSKIMIDQRVVIDDLTWGLFNDLNKLSPFGVENPKPVFVLEKVKIDEIELFGKTKDHQKIIFRNSEGKNINAIKFFVGGDDKYLKLESGQTIDLIFNLEKSTFGRYPELRLKVVEVFS